MIKKYFSSPLLLPAVVMAAGLLMCGVCYAELPFVLRAAQRLATYAKANGYTAVQVRNATPATVFNKLEIDPASDTAKQYLQFETIIKEHAVNFMGLQTPPTLQEEVMALIRERYPNATVTLQSAGVYVIRLNN